MKSSILSPKFLKEIIEIAKDAGKKLNRYQKDLGNLAITAKDAQGVVSNADIETEKFIIRRLKKVLPQSSFLAEESFFSAVQSNNNGKKEKDAFQEFKGQEWCWVIDPLDGTTNYLNCMDYFAVCIGLMHKGELVLGVVHRPAVNETFYAVVGKGAFWQREQGKAKRLKAEKNKKKMQDCLAVTGFASEKHTHDYDELELFYKIMKETRGVRRMGSAALDLCFVANGMFDLFWEAGLAPWDVAAAGLICQEAGVKISSFSGKSFDPFTGNFVAARAPLHQKFLKTLSIN